MNQQAPSSWGSREKPWDWKSTILRDVVRHSAVYMVASVLNYGMALLLFPLYAHKLTPAEYGVLDLLQIVLTLLLVTAALEVTIGFARSIADAESDQEKSTLASTTLWFSTLIYLVVAAVFFFFARPISRELFDRDGLEMYVRLFAVWVFLSGIDNVLTSQLRWQLKSSTVAIGSVVSALATIVCSVVAVGVLELGVSGAIIGRLLGVAVRALYQYFYCAPLLSFTISVPHLRSMLRFSLPLVPSSVGVVAAMYIDRWMVKELLSLHDLGLLGVGYRIASAVGLLLAGFGTVMTPLIFQRYKDASTPADLARVFRYFVGASALSLVGLSLFAPEALDVLAPPVYAHAAAVVPFLVGATLLSQMYIFAPGTLLKKRTGIIATINITGGVLNLLLNLALIPLIGIVGAALSTAFSSGIVFGMYMYSSQRLYFVPHRWLPLFAVTGYAVAMVGIWSVVVNVAGMTLLAVVVAKLSILASVVVVTFAVGVFEWDRVIKLLSRARVACAVS